MTVVAWSRWPTSSAPDSVVLDLRTGHSKRQVLKELATHAAALVEIDPQRLLALMERERLGTTGIGHGIAIPHARMAELKRLVGLFARLDHRSTSKRSTISRAI